MEKVKNSLKGIRVKILCRYIANFEKLVRKAKEEIDKIRNG